MPVLVVVNTPANWPLSVPGVSVVSARRYLTDPEFHTLRQARVFNLCRSYSYQSLGYYVSLLAEARGHRPQPDIVTIQDLKSPALTRVIADDLSDLIRKTLRPIKSSDFTLSIYFGQTLAKRDYALGQHLFGYFRSPLLRAHFVHRGTWHLHRVAPIPAAEIPPSHRPFVVEAMTAYFRRRYPPGRSRPLPFCDLAILYDPEEAEPPSNEGALTRFARAAQRAGMGVEFLTRHDAGRVAEFDALFIRATTNVNHYTYRVARRAAAERLAVIDDPLSIARCTNKVYLAERMSVGRIPTPRTVTIHRENVELAVEGLELPQVLKRPDSSMSLGVIKVETREQFRAEVERLLVDSDLIIAQPFMPTEYDWRIGVLDGAPLYACRYWMARRHWQIMKWTGHGKAFSGRVETLPIEAVPKRVVNTAVRAAGLIGNGLYGVDLKKSGGKVYVIEVNDNPSIDHGYEDRVLKDELYDRIIQSLAARVERLREGGRARGRSPRA